MITIWIGTIITPTHSTTPKVDGRETLLFFAIASSLLSTDELKATSSGLERCGEIREMELKEAWAKPCRLILDEFLGTELVLSTFCAWSEVDRARVELPAIFDGAVVVFKMRLWLEETKPAGVTMREDFQVAGLYSLDKLAAIVCECAYWELTGLRVLHINSSTSYSGHSHPSPLTSSLRRWNFPIDAQRLSQVLPVSALSLNGKALGLPPGTLWVTWPIHPWNLQDEYEYKMWLKVNN